MGLTTAQTTGLILASQAVSQIGETYSQYQANRSQGIYQQNIYEMNARIANLEAQDALDRGEDDAREIRRQTKQIVGAQRAAFAGQNVLVGSGSAGAIEDDTRLFGAIDAIRVKTNAVREAYGFKLEALKASSQARFASISSRFRSRNTLISGGIRALNTGLRSGIAFSQSPRFRGRPVFRPSNPTERRFDRDFTRSR